MYERSILIIRYQPRMVGKNHFDHRNRLVDEHLSYLTLSPNNIDCKLKELPLLGIKTGYHDKKFKKDTFLKFKKNWLVHLCLYEIINIKILSIMKSKQF